MCGILGVCLDINATRSDEVLNQMKLDFASLLTAAEVRGKDAAGVYIVNNDADVVYYKAPVAGSTLVDTDAFWKMLNDHVGDNTVAIIGHTRFATHGSPEVNANNHPVYDHPIIGVHNGMIRNHDQLDRRYKKAAEVDSAAIMSLLRVKSKNKPMTLKTLSENLHELDGAFAIAVADTRKPDGIFMARNTNPVNFHRNRENGALWFASTADILVNGLGIKRSKTFEMPPNICCRIDSKAVAGKLKYRNIERPAVSTPRPCSCKHFAGAACACPCHKATALKNLSNLKDKSTTPRVPRGIRQGSSKSKQMKYDIKPAKVCSTCNELLMFVSQGGIDKEICSCVSIKDLMRG